MKEDKELRLKSTLIKAKNGDYELIVCGKRLLCFTSIAMIYANPSALVNLIDSTIKKTGVLGEYNKYQKHKKEIDAIRSYMKWLTLPAFANDEDITSIQTVSDILHFEKELLEFFNICNLRYQRENEWVEGCNYKYKKSYEEKYG